MTPVIEQSPEREASLIGAQWAAIGWFAALVSWLLAKGAPRWAVAGLAALLVAWNAGLVVVVASVTGRHTLASSTH